uniref:UBC core domain-containing protein n=1 Tax=Amphiprion percula TaxID=161767 RepID=A0A3P8UGK4_AMPPE
FMEKDKRILEELKSLHCDPHPFCRVFPAESDFSECHGLLCLYCNGCHKYCFRRQVYHCNVNSVGRICHNIFDRNYNAHITMREVLDAVFGLLIIPEPKDPLDSVDLNRACTEGSRWVWRMSQYLTEFSVPSHTVR